MIIPPQYKLAAKIIAIVLMLGTVGYASHALTENQYEAKIAVIQADHALWIAQNETKVTKTLLDAETAKATAYKELNDYRGKVDETFKADMAGISSDIARLRSTVQLRDPGSKASTNSGGSGSTTGNSPGPSGGLATSAGTGVLSPEANEFLWGYAEESESVSAQLRACKDWNSTVRHQVKAYNDYVKTLSPPK